MENNLDVFTIERQYNFVNAINKIQTPTPAQVVSVRDGSSFPYISGDTCIYLLNNAFNYQWSFEVVDKMIVPGQTNEKMPTKVQPAIAHVLGRLTVPGMGVREQWGSAVLMGSSDNQSSAYKGATTDAMKKCATMFGVAIDVTSKRNNYWPNLHITPDDIASSNSETMLVDFARFTGQAIAKTDIRVVPNQQTQQPQPLPVQEQVVVAPPVQPQEVVQQQQSQQPLVEEIKTIPPTGMNVQEKVLEPTETANVVPNVKETVAPEEQPVMLSITEEEANALRQVMMSAGMGSIDELEATPFIMEATGNPNALFKDINSSNVYQIIAMIQGNM